VHNKITLLYIDSKDKKQKKIRGEIVALSDSSITIYQLLKNKQTEVPLKDIVRFSRANKSLLRYVVIGSVITLVTLEIALTSSNITIQEITSVLAYGGMVVEGYDLLPALIGEICRKHSIVNGWKLKTIKYQNYIVDVLEYRQLNYNQ
jgi:hypothetical protein